MGAVLSQQQRQMHASARSPDSCEHRNGFQPQLAGQQVWAAHLWRRGRRCPCKTGLSVCVTHDQSVCLGRNATVAGVTKGDTPILAPWQLVQDKAAAPAQLHTATPAPPVPSGRCGAGKVEPSRLACACLFPSPTQGLVKYKTQSLFALPPPPYTHQRRPPTAAPTSPLLSRSTQFTMRFSLVRTAAGKARTKRPCTPV